MKGLGKGGIKNSLDGFGRKAACKVGFGTCFTAGTLVRTPDGDKPIETLRPGDKVYTHDLTAGLDVIETIEETFVRTTTTLYHLSIAGHVVTTTDEHPFMVAGLGWIHARDLTPGDHLVTAAGDLQAGTVRLDAVNIERRIETVYNICVSSQHNYYVLAGSHTVLVHNSKCAVSSVAGPDGTPLFLPHGATGVPVRSGKGFVYEIPTGTVGIDPRVTHVRIMDPVTEGRYLYPRGYVVYMNKAGQSVHPITGQTLAKSSPYNHLPLS